MNGGGFDIFNLYKKSFACFKSAHPSLVTDGGKNISAGRIFVIILSSQVARNPWACQLQDLLLSHSNWAPMLRSFKVSFTHRIISTIYLSPYSSPNVVSCSWFCPTHHLYLGLSMPMAKMLACTGAN